MGTRFNQPRNPNFDDIIDRASKTHGVPVPIIKAIVRQESAGNPSARSGAGAQGLMQLMPETAKGLGVTDPYNPEQNIMGGTKYIRQMMDMFKGDVPKALAGYNAGPGAVKKYGGIPPYKETQGYVSNIMKNLGPIQGIIPNDSPNGPEVGGEGVARAIQPIIPPENLNQSSNGISPEQLKQFGLDEKSLKRERLSHLIQQLGSSTAGLLSSFGAPEFSAQYGKEFDERQQAYDAGKSKQAAELSSLLKASQPNLPNSADEYQYYVRNEQLAGNPKPDSYDKWLTRMKQAGAMSPIAFDKFGAEQANQEASRKLQQERLDFEKEKERAAAEERARRAREGHILPAAQSAMLAEGKNIPALLDNLDKTLNSNKGVGGPIVGRLQGMNPWATDTQKIQSEINAVKQTVGRFLEGGVLRKEDEEKYDKIMPTLKDTPEVRAAKLQNVRNLIQQKYNEYLDSFGKSGYNVGEYQTLGSKSQPQSIQPIKQPTQLSAEDQAAIQWAKQNPNDKRAAQILQMHGVQ